MVAEVVAPVLPALCLTHRAALSEDAPAQPYSYVCARCYGRIEQMLFDIREMYELIADDSFLAATREPCESANGSNPPVNMHVLAMTDVRTRYTRRGDPISPGRVLGAWASAVADVRDLGLPPARSNVVMLCAYLVRQLPWIAQQPAVERFARHLGATRHCLSSVIRGAR